MRSVTAGLILAAAVATAAAGPAVAAGEDERRLGAEIAIVAGDVRRLLDSPPEGQRPGILARIKGGLAGLLLLVRQARESNPHLPTLSPQVIVDARRAADSGQLAVLADAIAIAVRTYPFDPAGILPADPTPQRLRIGKAIHEETCAGCHDRPDPHAALPAHNLFRWIGTMPAEEFAARLYAGVRGDTLTSLANPFGPAELAALIAYYRAGQAD